MNFVKGISRILLVLWGIYNLIIISIALIIYNTDDNIFKDLYYFTYSNIKEMVLAMLFLNIFPAIIYFPIMWIIKGFVKK